MKKHYIKLFYSFVMFLKRKRIIYFRRGELEVNYGINYMISELKTLFIIIRLPFIYYNLDIHFIIRNRNLTISHFGKLTFMVWFYNNQKEWINVNDIRGFRIP